MSSGSVLIYNDVNKHARKNNLSFDEIAKLLLNKRKWYYGII